MMEKDRLGAFIDAIIAIVMTIIFFFTVFARKK